MIILLHILPFLLIVCFVLLSHLKMRKVKEMEKWVDEYELLLNELNQWMEEDEWLKAFEKVEKHRAIGYESTNHRLVRVSRCYKNEIANLNEAQRLCEQSKELSERQLDIDLKTKRIEIELKKIKLNG